ncbi:23697_t:CDS:1, partial [Racocetra persica]
LKERHCTSRNQKTIEDNDQKNEATSEDEGKNPNEVTAEKWDYDNMAPVEN